MKRDLITEQGETWFHISRYSTNVEEFRVTKSTALTVWYVGKDWNGKETGGINQSRIQGEWFRTKREALTAIRSRLERQKQYANDELSRTTEALSKFNFKHAGELG